MSKKLLFLLRSKTIFDRILKDAHSGQFAVFVTDFATLQNWLTQNAAPAGVLLDETWPESQKAQVLLSRFGAPVTYFSADFAASREWYLEHVSKFSVSSDEPEPTQEKNTALTEQAEPINANSPKTDRKSRYIRDDADLPSRTPGRASGITPVPISTEPARDFPFQNPASSEPKDLVVPVRASTLPPSATASQDRGERTRTPAPTYVTPETIVHTLQSRLVVFVALWPGAGASFLSSSVAYLLAKELLPGSVSLIEHPNQYPRQWTYYRLYDDPKPYTHWLTDGRGQTIPTDGIDLVPLDRETPPGVYTDEKLILYLHKHLRKPFLLVDAGTNLDDSMLLESADDLFLVVECDPSRLYPYNEYEQTSWTKRYNEFLTAYPNAHVILNKWTRHVDPDLLGLSPENLYAPYCDPDAVARAAWNGRFPPTETEIHEALHALTKYTMSWIPKELRKHKSDDNNKPFWRRPFTK